MRRMDRRVAHAGRWIVAAGSVMALSGAAVALGASSNQATTTVAPSSSGSATAKCKDGEVALAGGFAAPGWDPGTANGGPVARFDSVPTPNQRGIKTAGFNFNDNQAQDLKSFAYCGKRARPPAVRSMSVQIQRNTFDSVKAECPDGSRAIGAPRSEIVVRVISRLWMSGLRRQYNAAATNAQCGFLVSIKGPSAHKLVSHRD